WPGVTVEKYEGTLEYEGYGLKLVDTPGIYSLTSYTIEEKVTRKCVLDDDIEVIVNVVDASCLERNLYLTLQLLELGKPVILALNMMDIVKERGMEIDMHRLPEMLGDIPVVPVSAAKRTGLDILMHAVVHHYEEGPKN
ncbi:FeoB small GTPase domain-containing protein, partial [Eisenbergiella porci]